LVSPILYIYMYIYYTAALVIHNSFLSGERFSKSVKFANKMANNNNKRGSKTDMGGEIYGYEIFNLENSFLSNDSTKKFVNDKLKIAKYNREDLFTLRCDFEERTKRSCK